MRGTLAAVAVTGLFLGSMLWAAVTDMCKDEVRTRLGRLPYLLIRMAALRGMSLRQPGRQLAISTRPGRTIH
jgi:hypothetical protein